MEIIEICFICLFALIVVIASVVTIVNMVKARKERKEKNGREVNAVEEKNGVRYTPDATIVNKEGEMAVSFVQNDIILQPRKMVEVGKKSGIKPGKYTLLSAYGNETTFNVRIGQYVKEYKHGQEIVLVEGDEICPTSTTIILR